MGRLLIRNGRVLDPASNHDGIRDVWIEDGRFAEPRPDAGIEPDEVIDATGLIVMPGLVDVHVHLREPGNEAAETIATGCASALAGGFTSVVCMPNTTPALDTPERLRAVLGKAAALGGPRVYALAAITAGREGRELTDMTALADAGAVGFTDDGSGVQDAALLRGAMEMCAALNSPFVEHCEDANLSGGGVVHKGAASARLGLPGIPSEAESAMVERDIAQSELVGARLHVQHVSAARSVEMIRAAKLRGARVTAEVTPHHLLLSDQDAARGDANFKMNPPLRSAADRRALLDGVRDGVLDMIATDHAPHTAEAKGRGFREAPFGVIGMETALAVIWTCLVEDADVLSPLEMVARMSAVPAAAFGLPAGTLTRSRAADVTLFDPRASWTVDPRTFRSRSRNCPFAGWELKGRAVATIVGGEVKYRDDLC